MPKETTPSVAEQADERAAFEASMRKLSSGEPDFHSPAALWAWGAWQARAALAASQAASHRATEPVAPEAVRWADDLARYIADMTGVEIGKHSTPNNPWFNACEAARDFIQQREAAPLGPSVGAKYPPLPGVGFDAGDTPIYTAQDMQDYVDADRLATPPAAPAVVPELPAPDIRVDAFGDITATDHRPFVMGDFYSAAQMRAALAAPAAAVPPPTREEIEAEVVTDEELAPLVSSLHARMDALRADTQAPAATEAPSDWRAGVADLILHLHQWQAAPAGDESTAAWDRLQGTINALATPAPAVGASLKDSLSFALVRAKVPNVYWKPFFDGLDTELSAPASVQPVQASIEGTVTFMRSDSADPCRCCPPGGHIFSRYVKYDEWDTKYPKHFGNGADVLTAAFVTDKNENEGKRVRVTVEVLASSTPTKGGQTS